MSRDLEDTVGCEETRQAIPLLLDDELDAVYELELEGHLNGCGDCRAELEHEGRLRLTLRRAAASVSASASLRRRLHQAIEEDVRRRRGWGRFVPAAAAAAVLLTLVWRGTPGGGVFDPVEASAALFQRDDVPMDVTAAEVTPVQNYLRQRLPFAVDLPRSQGLQKVSLGGRVIRVGDRDAAFVRYELPRGRVSVVVYEEESRGVPEMNQAYKVGNTFVQLQRMRGYTAARWYSRGLAYTVVSDLPEQELVTLLDR